MPKYCLNEPTADILMNSMRSMGYSFESAIADIIDNSISAKASLIKIKFPVDPNDIFIAICDNGVGMSSNELFDAMKYGSAMKGSCRDESDLGRFGLGLKAASLSQCRKLTVVSKKNNEISAYVWDLDHIEQEEKWSIGKCTDEEIKKIKYVDFLEDFDSGTVVLWEGFDFIEKATGNVYTELSKCQESTSNYIALIFHRFLNQDKTEKIKIEVNNFSVVGMDPFLENHNKTNVRRRISLAVKDSSGIERFVFVQPYVLPFQKDLSTEDFKKSGGFENYRTKQGFYIYRNQRLIIWGTWFGRSKSELTKNARIKVDIPNTLDDIWGIDIKKQNAKIPNVIKNQLTKAVDEAMDIAVNAQIHRGRLENVDEKIDYIWNRIKERDNHYTYRINRNSKVFDLVKNKVTDEVWNGIDMVLEEIESSVPYQQIYIDKSQNKVTDDNNNDDIAKERTKLIEQKARILISMAMSFGEVDRKQIIEKLFLSEPFNNQSEIKEKLINEE